MGLGTFFAGLGEKAKKLSSVFSGLAPAREKIKINKKIVLIAAAALLVIVILLVILAIVSRPKAATQGDVSTAGAVPRRETLPQDEFFLPYEPDFVPDVLLEREPKDGWTEEDAEPFWTDPLDGNEAVWRKRIESEVDSILEHVP